QVAHLVGECERADHQLRVEAERARRVDLDGLAHGGQHDDPVARVLDLHPLRHDQVLPGEGPLHAEPGRLLDDELIAAAPVEPDLAPRRHQPILPASLGRPSPYISAMSAAYFSATTLRRSLSVGVSSPVSCERSVGNSRNFFTFSYGASSSFL